MGCFGKKSEEKEGTQSPTEQSSKSNAKARASSTKDTSASKESTTKKDPHMVRAAGEGGVIEEVTDKGGILYEKKENVSICRACETIFSIANSKVKALVKLERHHCRSCGGVFCDKCTQFELQAQFESYRCCPGCWRGEMPGDQLKEKMSHILELRGEQRGEPQPPAVSLTLSRGQKYSGVPGSEVPSSGYLEFVNKTPEGAAGNSVCCLKVLVAGGDLKFEVPRPAYIAVPPGEVVHCSFPAHTPALELLVLFGNPSHGAPHLFDTRAPDMKADRISNGAKVSFFQYTTAYKVLSQGKNVFLKYKGDGTVGVRAGNNMKRIGLKAKLMGNKKTSQTDSLDYATNVSEVEKLFQY